MPVNRTPHILAVAPGTRHLGYAVFVDQELVRFGVRTFEGERRRRVLFSRVAECLDEMCEGHRPDTLVVEDAYYAQARLSRALATLITNVNRWGKRRGLRIVRYLPPVVKEHFCEGKKTRAALAAAMVRRYWFLYRFLGLGRPQLYWRQMFDAVALGALAIDLGGQSSTRRSSARGQRTTVLKR